MKKVFTLLIAAVCALQLMAEGTASDTYLNVSKYATIDEAGATVAGMETIYKYTQDGAGYWLTLSNYGVMKTDETQNWFTNEVTEADTGTQYTNAWTATDVFQGPSAYFGSNPAYTAKYKQPAKKQIFYVTFCTQVKQYAYHRSTSSYYIFKMPLARYDLTLWILSSEQETTAIQGIGVELGKDGYQLLLHQAVGFFVPDRLDRHDHMELRSRLLAVFYLHVVTAVMHDEWNIRKCSLYIFRGFPIKRII